VALVMLYAMHALRRWPRVPAGAASCRLGQGAQEAARPRAGTSGTQRGHASLPWALSAAARLLLRHHDQGPQDGARGEPQDGTGQALPVLAPQVARAVDDRPQRATVLHRARGLHGAESRAGAPASLAGAHCTGRAAGHAAQALGTVPCSWAVAWPPALALGSPTSGGHGARGRPLSRTGRSRAHGAHAATRLQRTV
jgi:hypothetical protein